MRKILARGALVLALAGAVVAPQAYWLVLSPDRYAMTAVEVEATAAQEYTQAEAEQLDRIECEPIRSRPGTSRCEAQDDDQLFGLVLEVGDDGRSELFAAEPADLPTWSGG